MKILFVTENMPYPLDRGGYIRSSHLIRELSRQHQVTLLTSQESATDNQGIEFYNQFCNQVICMAKSKSSALKKNFYLLSSLWGKTPYPLNKNFSADFLNRIKEELANNDYQALHCDHLDAAQYLPLIPNAPKNVFDSHNLLSVLIKRLWEQEKSPAKKAYLELQLKKTKQIEINLAVKFDHCLVCSEQEKFFLEKAAPQANVTVIPNGVDVQYYQNYRAAPKTPQKPTLLFIGTMDYLPNYQGVLDFYQKVWPLVCKEIPEIKWQIVGRNPIEQVQKMAEQDNNIKIVAHAPDMRPYLAGSTIAIVPLHIGGGTRLKILEAMAAGLPVVSTYVGAEGINAQDGKEIIIADKPEDMAQKIVTLCRDQKRCQEIAHAANNFVAQYDWQLVGKKLLLCYNSS